MGRPLLVVYGIALRGLVSASSAERFEFRLDDLTVVGERVVVPHPRWIAVIQNLEHRLE
jgi:hypothetical protein